MVIAQDILSLQVKNIMCNLKPRLLAQVLHQPAALAQVHDDVDALRILVNVADLAMADEETSSAGGATMSERAARGTRAQGRRGLPVRAGIDQPRHGSYPSPSLPLLRERAGGAAHAP